MKEDLYIMLYKKTGKPLIDPCNDIPYITRGKQKAKEQLKYFNTKTGYKGQLKIGKLMIVNEDGTLYKNN